MKLNYSAYEEKMKKSIFALEENLDTIRASQANPAVLAKISFEYYGAPTPINTMADIRCADSKTLTITPYDSTTLKAMEKAIQTSDLGINPSNDGRMIRLVFPQLTEERRRELQKNVQKMGEEAKVAIRNIRRDANDAIKKMKKEGTITEDEIKASEKDVQDVTDKYIKQVETTVSAKEKAIMHI